MGDQGDRRQRKQKRFRKYIKSFWIDATGIAPLKGNERLFNASKDKADISRQYQSVHTNTVLEPDGDPYPQMEEISINEERMEKLLISSNPHKASRPDMIPVRLLKKCSEELAPILVTIFNKSL